MKSHELVERINNGEIKDGTKIDRYRNGRKELRFYFDNYTLKYDSNDAEACADVLLDNDAEFEIVEEHKGWFKPEKGQKYWNILSGGSIYAPVWKDDEEDCYRYKNHNVFRSYAEAQEYLDYKNALEEAEKPFVYGKDNCCIEFDEGHNRLYVTEFSHIRNQGITYLGQDEEVAQAFIDKWKKQILKYEFGIFE